MAPNGDIQLAATASCKQTLPVRFCRTRWLVWASLFFAGEATHPFDFTIAHGAHDSGQRAADEAMAALGNKRGKAA